VHALQARTEEKSSTASDAESTLKPHHSATTSARLPVWTAALPLQARGSAENKSSRTAGQYPAPGNAGVTSASGTSALTDFSQVVNRPDDIYEQEADRVAEQVVRRNAVPETPRETARPAQSKRDIPPGPRVDAAPPAVREALSSPGHPLDTETRATMEPRFDRDFSGVRIHADLVAGQSARAIGASAYTVGSDIIFAGDRYHPASAEGGRLLAHELTHVVQQGHAQPLASRFRGSRPLPAGPAVTRRNASAATIQRAPDPVAALLRAGDRVTLTVAASPGGTPEPYYSKQYTVSAAGAIDIDDGTNKFSIPIAGLIPQAAADRIAARFVSEQILLAPSVCLTTPGSTTPACTQLQPSDLDRAYANFVNYIQGVKEPTDALLRYYQWLDDHRGKPDLKSITPEELWKRSLVPPQLPKDPRADKTDEFLRFVKYLQAENTKITDPKEKARATESMSRFLSWYDKNKDLPTFPNADLAKVYADLSVSVLKKSINEDVAKEIAAQKAAAENSPEVLKARSKKFDEFYNLALKLWGYSARTFPYSIPLESEGKDILVTGDPALQKVLNALASDLLDWAAGHMFDSTFTTTDPKSVLLDLLKGGYSERLAAAQQVPLEHEVIDRNKLLPGTVLASFGESIGEGLLAIGVVGLFVGAEIITAGQATWIIAGVAAAGGVKSYLDRREEVEKSGYDVSIPETIVYSAGDVFGVSQLVEGITGQRLGTDVPLGSEARSKQLGTGGGMLSTWIFGSKAYRTGESLGANYRVPKPGLKPSGPNASADVQLPTDTMPPTPQPNPNPGPLEASMRAGVSDPAKIGFDRWMEDIRARGGDPEKVLQSLSKERVQTVAEQFAKKQATEVARAQEAARLQARAKDNPLRPILKHVEKRGNITIHYESIPPNEAEIIAAQQMARRTGEEIHLFGDTASKVSYPGIDGTIGDPPRPLSIKAHSPDANAGSARFAAQQALIKAKANGYTQVEVEISMPGKTVAEVKAAWDVGPTRPGDHPLGPVYEGTVVAKITIQCSDGVWTVPKGPALTGAVPGGTSPGEKNKKPGEGN